MPHTSRDSDHAPAPSWTQSLGIFDLETTGIDIEDDRIVSAHVGVLDRTGRQVSARTWLADPGIEIPDGAAAVHGITTADARRLGRPAPEVVSEVVTAIAELIAAETPIVVYNAPFDFSLLKREALRHGVVPIEDPFPVVDPLVLDKALDRYRRGKRTLDTVTSHYGVTLDIAHDAQADAVAAGRIALKIAQRYGEELPTTSGELHEHQVAWAREQAASLSDHFVKTGRIAASERLDGRWPIR